MARRGSQSTPPDSAQITSPARADSSPSLPATVEVSVQEASFSGPLPHPAILAQYDAVVPGAAQIIIQRAEKQSDHRMELERTVIQGDTRRAGWGLAAGFLVALSGIGSSVYLIVNGHDVAGSVLGGTAFVSLVSTFVYGSKSRKDERTEKAKIMTGQQQS